jgi:hypothetical protein
VRARVFQLLEHGTFSTQHQFYDVFRWRTELYRDREDHVDIHPGRFLLSPIFFHAWVAVTQLRVAATRSRVGVTLGRSDLNLLLETVVIVAVVLLLG